MKNLAVIAIAVLSTASFARADGFVCQTKEGDLNIKAYNHVNASEGTRNAAVLVLSDPSIEDGNKTTAKFTDVEESLGNSGATYVAKIDMRHADASKGGRLIAGTKIMYLDTVVLDVDFSYSAPLANGDSAEGKLLLNKRNGDQISRDVECTRYLKN